MNPQAVRANDSVARTHFRSDRISNINGKFFFATREGTLEGPYFTHNEACHGVDAYIQAMQLAGQLFRHSKTAMH